MTVSNSDLLGVTCDMCPSPAVLVLARHVDGYTREDPVLGKLVSKKDVGERHPRCIRHLSAPLLEDSGGNEDERRQAGQETVTGSALSVASSASTPNAGAQAETGQLQPGTSGGPKNDPH